MTTDRDGSRDEQLRVVAADWFGRMHSDPDAVTRDEFEGWLASDAAHRETYERLTRRWDQMAFAGQSGLGKERNLDRIAAGKLQRRRLAAVAAVPLMVAVGAVGIVLGRPGKPDSWPVGMSTKQAGLGRTLSLPDGSRAVLSDGAVFRLAFLRVERRVLLEQGSARFFVAHEPKRAFIVDVGGGSIIARGTIFDVAVNNADVCVALIEGEVEVVRSIGGVSKFAVLHQGQQMSFTKTVVPAAQTLPQAYRPLQCWRSTQRDLRMRLPSSIGATRSS